MTCEDEVTYEEKGLKGSLQKEKDPKGNQEENHQEKSSQKKEGPCR